MTNTPIADLLPGVSAMANIHPVLVHFPIALLSSFVIAEVLASMTQRTSLRQAASWMLYFGTVAAAAAVVTGLRAAATVEHGEAVHAIMERHETYGLAVLALAVFLSLWRLVVHDRFSRWARAVHVAGAVVLLAVVALGADLGGMMVYRHAVGITPLRAEAASEPGSPPQIGSDEGASSTAPESLSGPPPAATEQAGPESGRHTHSHTHKHSHRR